MRYLIKKSIWLPAFGAACFGLACQPPMTNTTTNTAVNTTTKTIANTTANSNASTDSIAAVNSTNANAADLNATKPDGAAIETKEPEQYQATVRLKVETSGAQKLPLPPIKADVARIGADRRMEFVLPTGEKLIYLETGGKKLLISPSKKQFAELTKEAVGFEMRSLLMPEKIVNQVKAMKGVERVGEEKYDGRDAFKYRYGATTDTRSPAGTVNTESFVLVDKETGLPLRSVTNLQSQNGGVQGVQGLSLVTEMSNIKTAVDAGLFAEPTDYKQVAPEEIKQQINVLFGAAAAIFGQMMKTGQPANSPNQ